MAGKLILKSSNIFILLQYIILSTQIQSRQLAEAWEICWTSGPGEHLWSWGQFECAAPVQVWSKTEPKQHQPHSVKIPHGSALQQFCALEVLALSRLGNFVWI